MTSTPRATPARSDRLALLLTLLAVWLHALALDGYGYFRDELYYVACGERLEWGYVDHPPFIAWVAHVADAWLGGSRLALRAPVVLAAALVVWLTARLVRALGGEDRAVALAGVAVLVSPYFLAVGSILTMNGFEPVFLLGSVLVLVRAADAVGSPRELLILGPLLGLGVLNKYSMVWFSTALALSLIAFGPRELLRRRALWIGVGIALLLVAPNAAWQFANDWPTREFMRHALEKNEPYGLLGFVGQAAQLAHPVAAPLAALGLVAPFVVAPLRRSRFVAAAAALVAALILATQAKVYYLAPAFPALFALGAVAAETWSARLSSARRRWLFTGAVGALALLGAALAPLALPLLPVEGFLHYQAALGTGAAPKTGERALRGALPQIYADMFGWPEMTEVVLSAAATLSSEERARAAVWAGNYGEAGAIAFFSRGDARALPVISGHNHYHRWGPGSPPPQTVLAVGVGERRLRQLFEDVQAVGVIRHPLARPEESDLPLWRARQPRTPLDVAWSELKHFR